MEVSDFTEFNEPLWTSLTKVQRPSRYVGEEWGSAQPNGKESVSFCLAFPDIYEIGMSYVGFQILYSLLRSFPDVFPDRVYCPWTDMELEHRENGMVLSSITCRKPLCDFDVIGFTLQYELTYTNILTMLDLGNIPLLSVQRSEGQPIVLAGGPGALVPEPLSEIIDVFCIGDGEPFLPRFCEVMGQTIGMKRDERLREISKIPGAYVPAFHSVEYGRGSIFSTTDRETVSRSLVSDLNDAPFPKEMIIPNGPIVHDRIPVEIFRGCTRGCRFCQAGMIYRPVRERSPETVCSLIEELIRSTGWDEIGLVSLASCDYSAIVEVIKRSAPILDKYNVSLSLPSLRMDNFSIELASSLEALRRGSITFAPEAGTQRLRDVINKGVTEKDIENSLKAAFEHGWKRVKLYFMMGLPTETVKDLDGITDIAQMALGIGRSVSRKSQVSVSVAGFVPKPHTPFQWEPQNTVGELTDKGRYLKSGIHDRNLSLHYHDPEQTFLEGVLARGGRELSRVIFNAWRKGARFDGWSEKFRLDLWMKAFDEEEVDPFEIANRERPEEEVLPWDHIDIGVSRSFLWEERKRSIAALITPDCRWSECNRCGLEKICKGKSSGKVVGIEEA